MGDGLDSTVPPTSDSDRDTALSADEAKRLTTRIKLRLDTIADNNLGVDRHRYTRGAGVARDDGGVR